MKWFGEPWPSAELRAPVCEDDADRMPVPVGELCERCRLMIQPTDRGVAIPFLTGILALEVYHHIRCFLAGVVGDEMAEHLTKGY